MPYIFDGSLGSRVWEALHYVFILLHAGHKERREASTNKNSVKSKMKGFCVPNHRRLCGTREPSEDSFRPSGGLLTCSEPPSECGHRGGDKNGTKDHS